MRTRYTFLCKLELLPDIDLPVKSVCEKAPNTALKRDGAKALRPLDACYEENNTGDKNVK